MASSAVSEARVPREQCAAHRVEGCPLSREAVSFSLVAGEAYPAHFLSEEGLSVLQRGKWVGWAQSWTPRCPPALGIPMLGSFLLTTRTPLVMTSDAGTWL